MKINVQITEKLQEEQRQRDEFNLKWIDLLTDGGKIDRMFEFEQIRLDAPSELLAIMKYRRILRENGRGEISLEQLKSNIDNKDKLKDLFQEMFLEPFLPWRMDFFYETVEEKYKDLEVGIEKLYLKHERDPSTRFLSIVLTL